MAADTPVIHHETETGLKLDRPIVLVKSAYSGAGTQREVQWQVLSGATVVYDTGLRAVDGFRITADTVEISSEQVPLSGAVTVKCRVRNTSDEVSSYSATVSLTFETAFPTAETWRESQ